MDRKPEVIFKKFQRGDFTLEDFNDLCRESALHYNEFGSGEQIKLFIPKGPIEGKVFLCQWDAEKAVRSKDKVIEMFTKLGLSDSVCVDEDTKGYWLVFTTNTGGMVDVFEYSYLVEDINKEALKKNIVITKKEIVRDLPYEHFASWYNRAQVLDETTSYLHKEGYEDFTRGMVCGAKNWNISAFSDYVQNYKPKGSFVKIGKESDSTEEKLRKIKEFVDSVNSED